MRHKLLTILLTMLVIAGSCLINQATTEQAVVAPFMGQSENHAVVARFIGQTISSWFCPPAYAADKGAAPVAYWRFDEGGGATAYDDSTNNNDGTMTPGTLGTNTAAGQMWTRQGKLGGAAEFDGTDDYVDCGTGSTLNFGTGNFTIEAWFKTNDSGYGGFVSKRNNNDTQYYTLNLGNDNKLWFEIRTSGGAGDIVKSDSTINDNNWHHAAGVRSGNDYTLYIDGVVQQDSATLSAGTVNPSGKLAIGSYWSNLTTDMLVGLIDDVRIYNYARTAAQVMADYNAGSAAHLGAGTDPNEGNPPVGYWSMNEGSGTTVYDRSGNNNNGTVTNATFAAGKYASALSFDGTDDHVSTPITSSFSALTVTAWVKCSDVTWSRDGTGVQEFITKWESGNKSFDFRMTDGQMEVLISPGADSNGEQETSTLSLASNRWTFIAFTYDDAANTVTIYKDGDSETFTNAVTMGGSTAVQIGRLTWSGTTQRNFKGLIDEVKIYDYARTQAQIAYDYNKGKPIAHYRFDEGTGPITRNDSSQADAGSAPVGWWRMDEGAGGTTADESGNGNTGTVTPGAAGTNTTTAAMWDQSGKIGPDALEFDGTDDYVDCGSGSTVDNIAVTTYTAWIKPVNFGESAYPRILAKEDSASSTGWAIGLADTNELFYTHYFGSFGRWDTPSNSITLNEWNHIAIIFDSSSASNDPTIYINGVSQALTEVNNPTSGVSSDDSTYSLLIGNRSDTERTFNGLIDDVRIYDYARTAEQIYNDYKNTHGTLVADTKFVDGKIGKALEFDGTGDYVDCGNDSSLNLDDNFTISTWIKLASGAATTGMGIVAWGEDSAGKRRSLVLWNGGSGDNKVYFSGYAAAANLGGTTAISDTDWHHIAVTLDSSDTATVYLDGVQDNTGSVTLAAYTYSGAYIGATPLVGDALDEYFNGLIDDVRIYNYARTAQQIMDDYNSGSVARLGAQGSGLKDPWGGNLPVAHWKLDENTGVLARDASGNGNDTTKWNGTPTWKQGKFGSALYFDGTGTSGLEVSSPTGLNSANFTGEVWVDGTDQTAVTRILNWGTDGSNYGGWIIGMNDNGTVRTYIDTTGSGGWSGFDSVTAVNDGNWHHLVLSYDGTNRKIYIDGVLDNSGTVSYNASPSSPIFTIGQSTYDHEEHKGKIDDVRIYNYARTQAQIAWDYNAGKPVGHWRMDEATSGAANAQTIYDDSDNDNDGTANYGANNTGMTWTTGKFGGALNFDGVDDQISVTDNAAFEFSTGSSFTMETWFKSNETGSAGDNVVCLFTKGFHTATGDSNAYIFGYWGADFFSGNEGDIGWWDSTNSTKWAGVSTAYDNNWHHFVVTKSGTSLKMYYDGQFKVDHTITDMNFGVNSSDLIFVRHYDRYLAGLIDDVRIYNYARTAAQIMEDYNAGSAARLGD